MEDLILINNIFTGRYLAQNIGHEFINLYQCDNGNYYIYVNPYGNIDSKNDNNVKYVVLVRSLSGQKKLQVIGYCEVEEQILINAKHPTIRATENTKNESIKLGKRQKDYIENNKIYYGGFSLYDIFKDNTSNINTAYFITYKVHTICLANNEIILPITTRTSESMKIYIDKNNQEYKYLIEKIKDKKLWDSAKKIDVDIIKSRNKTFLEIIRKNYDETIISNLLSYFLSEDSNHWKSFQKILNLNINETIEYIYRETECNIDIFIRTKNHIIVIENKIKSTINGLNNDDKKMSQLKKYYKYAIEEAKNSRIDKSNVHFFILRPDYNKEDISSYDYHEYYTIIYYSQLYDIISNIDNKSIYLDELYNVSKIHKNTIDNELYDYQNDLLTQKILKLKDAMYANKNST